jgi:hypothetical protein
MNEIKANKYIIVPRDRQQLLTDEAGLEGFIEGRAVESEPREDEVYVE